MGAQRTLYVNSISAPGTMGLKSSEVRLTSMICRRAMQVWYQSRTQKPRKAYAAPMHQLGLEYGG